MPIHPEATRLDELARLGLSAPLIRLAGGELIHPLFDPRFVGPPDLYSLGEEERSIPDGPELVPLWSFAGGVQGIWEAHGALEFIDYDEEHPETFEVVAHTEQGFLAWMFIQLHEDNWDYPEDMARLADAADAVGFLYWREWVASFETVEDHAFIAAIDALKTSRDRKRN